MHLSVREAARYLGVTEEVLYRWISEGEIPHLRIDGQYRLNRTQLVEWAGERNLKVSTALYRRDPRDGGMPSVVEALEAGRIVYRLPGLDKPSVLRAVVEALPLPEQTDREALFQILVARERLGSTALGGGIALPHVRHPIVAAVPAPSVSLFFLEHAIDFGAPDGRPVDTVFLLVIPRASMHAPLLGRIAALVRDPGFASALARRAPIVEILNEARRVEVSLSLRTDPVGARSDGA